MMSPHNLSTFTANTSVIHAVCKEIDGNIGTAIPQPVLIIGQDGSGKTLLLKKLLTKYPDLQFVWIDGRFVFNSADIIEQTSGYSVILVDNLDYYLNRCTYEEQFRLRRFLYNEGAPMLIATVSKLTPAITEYKAPFFEGLKKIHLPPISIDEISFLFDEESISRVKTMFNILPPTIKSVEIISQIIKSNNNPDKDINLLLSFYSDIYKKIYISIPTNSQHILNILGISNTGMSIPEIRDMSGLPSSVLTSYLKSLRKEDIIFVDKSIKRNTKYLIKDPLFRIWLQNEALRGPENL